MSRGVVRIERRYRGPPDSGNGGYSAGLLAMALGGSGCTVTLRRPPPLATDLRIAPEAMGGRLLLHGEELIAEAAIAPMEIDVPAPPTLQVAQDSEARFAGFCDHNFPGCFVCGPDRAVDDGLRIFPGAVGDASGQVAAVWNPTGTLANDRGCLPGEIVWAALDCAGYYAVKARAGVAVLGRIGAVIHRPIVAEEPVVVTGWPIASDGRKHSVGTALHDRHGVLLAAALGTWVTLRPPS